MYVKKQQKKQLKTKPAKEPKPKPVKKPKTKEPKPVQTEPINGDKLTLGFVVSYIGVIVVFGAIGFFGSGVCHSLLKMIGG